MTRLDLTGQRFGRLVAVRAAHQDEKSRVTSWLFRCDCGAEKVMQPSNVRNGGTVSCGCYFREMHGARRAHVRDEHGVFCVALDRGLFSRIDDSFIELITASTWYVQLRPACPKPYAVSQGKTVLMHRLVIGARRGQLVDHINGDSLDNRRANIRICTAAENAHNRRPWGRSSKYKGVTLAASGRWQAALRGKYIGTFDLESEAALAYDAEAAKKYGKFAWLNFPPAVSA